MVRVAKKITVYIVFNYNFSRFRPKLFTALSIFSKTSNMKYLRWIDWNKLKQVYFYIFQKDKLLREKIYDSSTFFLWTDHDKIH